MKSMISIFEKVGVYSYSCIVVVTVVYCSIIMNSEVVVGSDSTSSLIDSCRADIQNLGNCLMYVTGKEADPSKDCCNTVGGIKDRHPVCLCFFIAQAHNGSQTIKSLGIKESKLLQLPNACHLLNATVSNCPALLGISPNSSAAAIFMNNNATNTGAGTGAEASLNTPSSNTGFKQQHPLSLSLSLIGFLIILTLIHHLPLN